jgi:hypothetical protein
MVDAIEYLVFISHRTMFWGQEDLHRRSFIVLANGQKEKRDQLKTVVEYSIH